ncbi:hypothetical protein SNOG_05948 [Parastagonospora nodorum SN15]|uniref:Mitochondrial carrier protein n=1 Tax=Phaeosphaeria nodorum (strain SN15 / ATCC MYA-4574 / FGSC 10173) TaxID=321614 RepID=Q0UQL6_PHANO|nr:hypothetical protein SNOG_05948 [Parastagonospora nodorum SN15]EAT87012.2 hypothetical protein SNOG_05948 [Parastagonospora nodorum SN15]
MVLARVANFFTNGDSTNDLVDKRSNDASAMQKLETMADTIGSAVEEEIDDEAARPPYIHAMLAGGIGGTTGDMLMHSLDTVKTRQQGDPHMPPKYTSMGNTYYTIWRQEGFRKGLYGGVQPAFLGSFAGTVCFFGAYEWSKRTMIDYGIAPSVSYFAAGLFADLAAAPAYVPSEVLKTRLQLQGRHNNPYFNSGYNYRNTIDAARTIARVEGFSALFHGYKATLWRDLPFSALQFAFYEELRDRAKRYQGSHLIGLPLEIATAASAGGMAGLDNSTQSHCFTDNIDKTLHSFEAYRITSCTKSTNIYVLAVDNVETPRRSHARYLLGHDWTEDHIQNRRNCWLVPRGWSESRMDQCSVWYHACVVPDTFAAFRATSARE